MQILGVNAAGLESDNDLMTSGRTLPWLQDTDAVSVWGEWGVEYRDVVVLDAENRITTRYNLTEHDLSLPENSAALRELLVSVAEGK